ncbi:AMP-binding protein [Rhodobacterales bacterium HKCCE4037]|nr:AMP-binding protein [Rhodobacterales bacterium HKCCE4037]
MQAPLHFNLVEHVLAPARHDPDKIALAILGPAKAERWSYGRLAEAVARAAGGLQSTGLTPGAQVMLRLTNSANFPLAFLGTIAAGYIPLVSSAALTSHEVTRLAEAVVPHAIIADPGVALPDHAAPVFGTEILQGPKVAPVRRLSDDLAYIVFTSGTSGQPKAVRHAHRAIWARGMMVDGWYGLRPTDRVLHAGALNWTYTLGTGLLDPWAMGATALVPADGTDPATLGLLAKRHDATILAGSPGLFRKLLARDLPAMPKLRHALSAGEALPPSLRARWREATGTDIHEALGMSECSTFLSGSPARPAPDGCIGYAQEGRNLSVFDDDGAAVPDGTVGHLAIHRSDPGLTCGITAKGGQTSLPLTNGHFVTGDLVARRPDGAYVYHGRADDILTAGGFRIAPAEIEAAFDGAPGLTECAALTIRPNPETTILALAYAGPATEDALAAYAEPNLAKHKRPRVYLRVDALPRGGNGKLNRRALGAILEESS